MTILQKKRLEQFKVIITSDHPQAHRRINGLRVGDGRVELVATITSIEDEPTELGAIDSGFILKADPQAMSGMSISPAGDINGDGVDDFWWEHRGKMIVKESFMSFLALALWEYKIKNCLLIIWMVAMV